MTTPALLTWLEILNLRELAPMLLLVVLFGLQSYCLWRAFR